MKQRTGITLTFLIAVLSVTGCATKEMPQSGFLKDYTNFVEMENHQGLYVKRHSDVSIKEYQKIKIAPVTIYFDAESKKINDEALTAMTESLREGLAESLNEKYDIVDESGPGVLLVKTAITDVKANKVYLNLHWSTTLSGLGIGGASIEAEFIDSQSGQTILAVVSAQKGKRLKYFKGLTKWGHTNNVVHGWGAFLMDCLEQL